MSRRLEDLQPIVAGLCKRFVSLCKERGIDVIVTSTLRSEAEQRAFFAQGRRTLWEVNAHRADAGLPPIAEAQNKIITKNPTSVHQFGCAFDVAIVTPLHPPLGGKDGGYLRGDEKGVTPRPIWDIKADLNKNQIPDYEEIGAIGEAIGLRWGGRFTFKDYVHFEYTGGLSLAELKAGKRPAVIASGAKQSQRGAA